MDYKLRPDQRIFKSGGQAPGKGIVCHCRLCWFLTRPAGFSRVGPHMVATARARPISSEARPFLKWVGGKRQLIDALLGYVPRDLPRHTYFEPFVGGGALFFAVRPRPKRAVLSDTNLRLVRTYRGVRDRIDQVVRLLADYKKQHGPAFFQRMRELQIDELDDDAQVAAWMIYLNKTAYNGLYRVNSRNVFNVPFGRYANPAILDEPNLRACSQALADVDIEHGDFGKVVARSRKGDFAYFDPPYVPLSATSDFTGYTADGFGAEHQKRLRDVARKLKDRGVHVLLSNSGAGFVREIYDGFELREVEASRQVNCKADGRGKIKELIIR
jgi:DNA adenine methylase